MEDIDGICFAFTAPDAGDNDGKRFSMWDRIETMRVANVSLKVVL